jgi:hypothetical protein
MIYTSTYNFYNYISGISYAANHWEKDFPADRTLSNLPYRIALTIWCLLEATPFIGLLPQGVEWTASFWAQKKIAISAQTSNSVTEKDLIIEQPVEPVENKELVIDFFEKQSCHEETLSPKQEEVSAHDTTNEILAPKAEKTKLALEISKQQQEFLMLWALSLVLGTSMLIPKNFTTNTFLYYTLLSPLAMAQLQRTIALQKNEVEWEADAAFLSNIANGSIKGLFSSALHATPLNAFYQAYKTSSLLIDGLFGSLEALDDLYNQKNIMASCIKLGIFGINARFATWLLVEACQASTLRIPPTASFLNQLSNAVPSFILSEPMKNTLASYGSSLKDLAFSSFFASQCSWDFTPGAK